MDKQTIQRWVITVGGVEQAKVEPGQAVEIGRKPIRPLPDSGFLRVDIVDNKRSMSKRHALLRVDEQGVATLRDLHSTNGTYLVGANGELMVLDPEVDFRLPDGVVCVQLGDVPVDFLRIAQPVESEKEPRNLFSYATEEAQEHVKDDLSLDQILDVRAGEPTGIFHAQSVTKPSLSWDNGVPVDSDNQHASTEQDKEAYEDQNGAQVTLPVVQVSSATQEVEPRNLFADAQAAQEEDVADAHSDDVQNAQEQEVHLQEADIQEAHNVDVEEPDGVAAHEDDSVKQRVEQQVADVDNVNPNDVVVSTFDQSNQENAYTPVFEAGSVFAKVSQGEFDVQQPIVEAGGFTSDQAERTNDFAEQFAMAKFAELLPFLAKNTGLYDDLYAWLAAQHNDAVDQGLARNSGYAQYRQAIGK